MLASSLFASCHPPQSLGAAVGYSGTKTPSTSSLAAAPPPARLLSSWIRPKSQSPTDVPVSTPSQSRPMHRRWTSRCARFGACVIPDLTAPGTSRSHALRSTAAAEGRLSSVVPEDRVQLPEGSMTWHGSVPQFEGSALARRRKVGIGSVSRIRRRTREDYRMGLVPEVPRYLAQAAERRRRQLLADQGH